LLDATRDEASREREREGEREYVYIYIYIQWRSLVIIADNVINRLLLSNYKLFEYISSHFGP
jgi:hypothetical protein